MIVRAMLASVGCAALLVTSGVSAEAASPIQFGRIYFNSPGTDRATNLSVNGECVVVKNGGTTARSLTGWTTRYWGLGYRVWNNTGDKAVLRNAAGAAVDSCSWASNGLGHKSC